MAAYRVTCKPNRHECTAVEYDVEEELEMRQYLTMKIFSYWSYLEGPFDTLKEASDYVEQLLIMGSDRVAKEYR
jgi:hypothetical protein